MNYKLLNSRLFYFAFSIIYFFILCCSYIYLREAYFTQSTFNFSIFKLLHVITIFISFISFLPYKIKRISDLFISIIFFNIISPLLIVFAFDIRYDWEYIYSVLTTFLLIIFFRGYGSFSFLPVFKIDKRNIILILEILSIFGLIYLSIDIGFNSFNLNPKLVYNFRSTEFTLLGNYILSWLSRITIPIIACFSYQKKNYINLIICTLALIFIYGISSEKSILLLPLFGILVSIYFDKFKNLSIIPIVISTVILLSFFLFIIFGFNYLPSMVIRRSVFVPAEMILHYLKFFDYNQFTYWSQNLIGNLFSTYPYEISPGELINKIIFAKDFGSSNVSFFGTAFMHAGIIGSIVYGIIMGFIFRFIDYFSSGNKNFLLITASAIVPLIVIITSSDLPTGILTHGLFLSLILIPFIQNKKIKINLK